MPAELSAQPHGMRRPAGGGPRGLALRFVIGGGLGVFARLFNESALADSHHLGLDLLGGGAFLAGLIWGWAALIGFWAGEIALQAAAFGGGARPEMLLPFLVLGASGYAAFRFVYRVDRRLPDLRSYLVLFASAVAASAIAAAVIVRMLFASFAASSILLWFAALLATIVLLAPAALILCPHALWRWRQPIGKESARRAAVAATDGRARSDSSSGLRLVDRRRELWSAALVVGAVTAIHLLVRIAGTSAPFHHWLFLLYSLPILYASYRRGLHGGLLAASLVGLSLLLAPNPLAASGDWHLSPVERQGGVILFSLFGAVAGATRERERALTRQLERSNRTLRQDLERVLAALRSAMEAKDQYTEGHLRRVCDFAVEVGRRLKLKPHELELLEIASLLHDVGKIGISESILRKPGPLDPRERELMQRHPAIGARILENVEGLTDAATMVRHHQERFDGRQSGDFPGYPDGLAGREIPLGARIIAVVDAFDAMTSDRPYRDAIGLERAKQALRDESGGQFDPRVVETFLELIEERDWAAAHPGEAVLPEADDEAFSESDEREATA